jgi:dihydropteroate synthase
MAVLARGLRGLFPDLGRRTLIMGILNVTPDSFSDGGAFEDPDQALDRALEMMDAGADLIDVGGESTRPGSEPVDAAVERARVVPVITRLARHGVGPISVDTTKAPVARAALEAGAHLVNDISALSFDPDLAAVAAAHRAPVVLMHTRGRPKTMQTGSLEYEGGVIEAVRAALEAAIARAESAGIARGDIVVDPGLGFGKTVAQNTELIRNLGALATLGCPILVGPSRKSFLGQLTGRDIDQRRFATAAAVAVAIDRGADFVRVHDVREIGDVVRVADAIARGGGTSVAP